ncbi:hypothetical protein SAMN05421630_101372 [Prauserella marina]|uniref:Uncharacterized protein n=1 Tax=Prauserella marina TaxID=530584 RepID=A0A1G6IQ68_9PSEU|nr:hypothetical protein SAMN05421630_101372 [Prauserella marina]
MWGRPARRRPGEVLQRTTPACAGKTQIAVTAGPVLPGPPPRVRGRLERWRGVGLRARTTPRVRGRLGGHRRVDLGNGTTPACAGKTTANTCAGSWPRDHPRVCGEDYIKGINTWKNQGPPPRVRGRLRNPTETAVPVGTTPACAGKTIVDGVRSVVETDHPRVCGEDPLPKVLVYWEYGPPPRVRGRRVPNHYRASYVGTTPACAGKTILGPTGSPCSRDHPRVCGEDTS